MGHDERKNQQSAKIYQRLHSKAHNFPIIKFAQKDILRKQIAIWPAICDNSSFPKLTVKSGTPDLENG